MKLHLNFQAPSQLYVNPIFFHVNGSYQGKNYQDVQPDESQWDGILDGLNELYPIDVRAGTRQDVTVAPDTDADALLDKVDDASGKQPCFAIAASPNVWLGLFPGEKGSFKANEGNSPGTTVDGESNVEAEKYCGVPAAWSTVATPANSGDAIRAWQTSAVVAAHEIGHLIGFDHHAGCMHQDDNFNEECRNYPIPHGGIGGVGFDSVNSRAIQPDTSTPTPHTHDFMATFVDYQTMWVSWFTYQILFNHSTFDTYDANDPPALLVSGRISPRGVATFRPAYRMNVPRPIVDTIVEDDPNDIYTIRGYDARGNTILLHNFEPKKRDKHGYPRAYKFTEAIPAMPNLRQLVVFKGGVVLGETRVRAATLGAGLNILWPSENRRWLGATQHTIRWAIDGRPASDFTALVEFSVDGGRTRTVLGRDISGTSLTVNASSLPGSNNSVVFVQVSDGLHTAEVNSPRFIVDPKSPSVHIKTPRSDSVAMAGMALILHGRAFDRQAVLEDSQFRWSSDRDGFLGTGPQLTASHLSVGQHVITLTVTNRQNMSSKDAVRIRVRR